MATVADPANVARAIGPRASGNEAESLPAQSRRAGFNHETINDFLNRQPQQTLVNLYQRPCNALAVFRLLPPMGRQLVMHLLFLDDTAPLAKNEYMMWVKRGSGKRAHEEAVERLTKLHILREQNGRYLLSGVFRENMQRALMGGGEHRSFGVPFRGGEQNTAIDTAVLDDYARKSWEAIMHYMVGSSGVRAPRQSVLGVLRQANLMSGNGGGGLEITSRGFQFLLEDVNAQLWDLLLQYLEKAPARGMNLVEVLSFLFMLGSLTLGQSYSTEDLRPTQLKCLEEFRDYGLVYQEEGDSRQFWPTRLATTLTNNDASPLRGRRSGQSEEERGFIVLETNYRLYAYTSNPLRIAVLQLFTHIRSQFPNLIIGVITRESIKAALQRGISAEQVITYLSHHAHPQMVARNDPLLPITVTDQIRLWEREKNRVQQSFGALFRDFSSNEDFRLVRNYAKDLSVLVWQDESRRRLFVQESGVDQLRKYIREKRL